jgi:hypothetical protein
MPDTTNYNAIAGTLLSRGSQVGTAIGPAANNDTDVLCQGEDELIVEVAMTGSAIGDLVVTVLPFQSDNATLQVNQLPPMSSDGPDLAAGTVYFTARYDVTAYERVRIRINNANVGAQTISRASWRLAGG